EADTAAYTDGHEHQLHPHRWRTWAIDLNPTGINKSVGIATLLHHLGMTREEAAAFGDGKNDIEMLQYVGRGIAMGNACQELLSTAPYRTHAVHEDGILHGVQTIVLDLKFA
ncbi:MAG: HAD family hydrolase, partial [Tumebacillaceae bacterium]